VSAFPVLIVRIAIGLGLGLFGILVVLGLDGVVGPAPWLAVSLVAGFAAALLGGAVGGVAAAMIGFAGQVYVIPEWLPAVRTLEGRGSLPVAVTAALALGGGLLIRRLILSGGAPPPGMTEQTGWVAARHGDEVAPAVAAAPPSPTTTDLDTLASAIRDFGAVRTPVQLADALARHVAALSGARPVTVYLEVPGSEGLHRMGRTGGPDTSGPERLEAAAVDRIAATLRSGEPPSATPLLLPITVQTLGRRRTIGAVQLQPGSGELRANALLSAVVQLAGDALERVRLEGARRAADDDATTAARRLAIVGRLALELVGGRTIEEVTSTLLDFAVDDLGAGFAALHVADGTSHGFRLAGARGLPAGLIASQRRVAADAASPVSRAAGTRQRVEISGEDGWRAAFPRTSNVPEITGVRAISAMPMVAGDAVHGVLTIGWRTASDRSATDDEMLAGAAAQGAQALERAILHAQDEEARRFQEAFIGVVSHELRTPITTILAGSRLLSRRLDGNAAAAELTEDIQIEADRLTRIVDDLLVLSRLERRHLTIGDDPVHLDHLLTRIVRSESARWPSHAFELPESPNRHVVLGEETYVEQVLRNLISNAAKYSPAGSTIRIRIDDTPTGEVEVRVLDQGPGVASGEVDDLFTLFYRSPTTAALAAGAGIGLFVSRQLVTEMGGRVWAAPRPEGGSEFGFSLSPYPIDEPEPTDDELTTVVPGTIAVEPERI
jgi:signal transduction histidine kinase